MNNSENGNNRKKELETRVLSSKGRSLIDLELIELIIYSAYNKGENREVAEKLIGLFKSVGKVISADYHELKSVTGMNDSAISSIICVRETIERMLRKDLKELPIVENQKKLIEYLKITLGQLGRENFRVIYLNKKSRIIEEYIQDAGTVDRAPLYVREVIYRALSVKANAMVIAHNHLVEAKPSQHDISLTQALSLACSTMEIELIDHIIVTEKNYFSFAENKLL